MEQLRVLAQQVERQRKLQAVEDSLRNQQNALEQKVRALKDTWNREQEDVDKLNRSSLTALFYDLLGKKAERLEKEQREALAAAAKYQTARAELENVKRELDQVRTELQELRGCEGRYERAKQERAAQLKMEHPTVGPRIAQLETELAGIAAQKRELQEALHAGRNALQTAREVQKELDSAESWGTYDMLGGGGLIVQMAKHDHLDSAQAKINYLQKQLRTFRTELTDVEIQVEFQIQIDDFLRFADWFFDGLIVDWTVQDKIRDAQNQMYAAICQIQKLLDRLDGLNGSLLRREDQVKEELETLVLSH